MRNLESLRRENLIPIQKEIHIQKAWSTGEGAHPAGLVLSLQGGKHDLFRGQARGNLGNQVQETRLMPPSYRFRLVNRRHPDRGNPFIFKHLESHGQLAGTVAQIGAQAQIEPAGVPDIIADDGPSTPCGPLSGGALTLSEIVCYLSASFLSPDS